MTSESENVNSVLAPELSVPHPALPHYQPIVIFHNSQPPLTAQFLTTIRLSTTSHSHSSLPQTPPAFRPSLSHQIPTSSLPPSSSPPYDSNQAVQLKGLNHSVNPIN